MNTPGPGLRGGWSALEAALRLELMEGSTGIFGVWQDVAWECALKIEDVSADVVKAVNDAAQRVARYRMRVLTWEELKKLGVGWFGRATYEAWSGNAPIAPAEPFTLTKLEAALRIMKGERCPMQDCEDSDCVQRAVPVHVTEEQFERDLGIEPGDLTTEQLAAAFDIPLARILRFEPDGHTLADVTNYVQRVLGDRHPTIAEQVRLFAEHHREMDGRIDRVTVAAQVASWMAHPSREILQANAARHREAIRRRWAERTRPRHPDLLFRR